MSRKQPRLSRRTALKAMTGLVLGVYLKPELSMAQSGAAQILRPDGSTAGFAPNAFVRIGTDDTVTVLVKHIEFGQGPFTGLATLVAEELDADWSKVRAEHAPADANLYKIFALGAQGTAGSTAIANSYKQRRKAVATARAWLVQAAAEAWRVPASEITVERGVLRHPSGRHGGFGEFAEAASRLPVPADAPLKPPSAFRLIGQDGVRRLDGAIKVNGTAQYGIDIREPGMLTVLVAHPPRFGGKVASFDAASALQVSGVVDVKQIPTGIAVYARGYWPARKARDLLRIEWDDAGAERRGSEQLVAEYRELARRPGAVANARGDAEVALARAGRVIEAEFVFPYLAHAPMEPLDGFLRWDGERATARYGSQFQSGEHAAIAGVLGLPLDRVEIETMLAGGSFGRRAQPSMHFAAELAQVAKAIGPGRPVKLMWTREDDIRGGYYRSLFVHRLRGGISD